MDGADTPQAEPAREGGKTPTSIVHQARHRLRNIGALIASVAAVGAVASGLLGYWNVWKTIRTDVLRDTQSVQKEATARPEIAPRLSLVVLPFTNLNLDPEQDYFADAITTDLTTDLGQMPGAFVIGRGTAFTYKKTQIDPRTLGKELGVRWAVQGAVRRNGDQVRINVALTDLSTGGDVWSDRFDGDRANLVALQDEITARLARSLNVELINAESRRGEAERAKNPDAVDFAMRGWAKFYEPRTKAQIAQAKVLFDQSLRLDPANVDAMIGMAWCLQVAVLNVWSASPASDRQAATKLIDEALANRPKSALAHMVKAETLRISGRPAEALEEHESALQIDPNYAPAHGYKGFALILLARPRDAILEEQIALRLSPKDPLAYIWHFYLCQGYWHLHDFDAAVPECRRCLDLDRAYWFALARLLSIYGATGRLDEARRGIAEMDRIRPDFSVQFAKGIALSLSPNARWRRDVDDYADGLRKAGVREQ